MSSNDLSSELAKVDHLVNDAFNVAMQVHSYITFQFANDNELPESFAATLANSANHLANKGREAGVAHRDAPLYLVAAADGVDAHQKALEYSAVVNVQMRETATDPQEMARHGPYHPFSSRSISANWDQLRKVFESVEPGDESLRDKMRIQIAKAEMLWREDNERERPNVPPDPVERKPTWNRDTGKLFFDGKIIKKIRSLTVAKNAARILDTFEDDGWPDRIDDPLSPSKEQQRLHESIRRLNGHLAAIRFRADGTGTGIVWELATDDCTGTAQEPHRD